MPRASSQEYPGGRQSMYTRFFRQLPCENGFGGAGPGTSDLWAWFRIYSVRACTRKQSNAEASVSGRTRERDERERVMSGPSALRGWRLVSHPECVDRRQGSVERARPDRAMMMRTQHVPARSW
ncbi:hypothetical protein BV20DRAFT_842588 [Pilatotrama ljubarskyi]|nr:hypothetical protein BV20DRAFT_842588 [Pilatotrama ljubarskyi]